jgi:hypothetical protein
MDAKQGYVDRRDPAEDLDGKVWVEGSRLRCCERVGALVGVDRVVLHMLSGVVLLRLTGCDVEAERVSREWFVACQRPVVVLWVTMRQDG